MKGADNCVDYAPWLGEPVVVSRCADPSSEALIAALTARAEKAEAALKAIEGKNAPELIRMMYENGKLQADFGGFISECFGELVNAHFQDIGAKNYIEIQVQGKDTGPILITFQRQLGQTPHQLRLKAEAERTGYKADFEQCEEILNEVRAERDALKADLSTALESHAEEAKKLRSEKFELWTQNETLKAENAELREKLRWKKWPEEKPIKDRKYYVICEDGFSVAMYETRGSGYWWKAGVTHWREIAGPTKEDSDD